MAALGDAMFHRLTQDVLREVERHRLAMSTASFVRNEDKGAPPVARLLDFILAAAAEMGASDVHFEPQTDVVRIRYRVDGLLQEWQEPLVKKVFAVFLSRVKVLAHMNVSEQRRPQDGQLSFLYEGKRMDVRVATMPTALGECLVLRLLAHGGAVLSLARLGLSPEDEARLGRLIRAPAGFLLLAGPMGAGKTTTLYAVLAAMQGDEEKIVTLDDPVEYLLPGLTQVPIREEIGLTFAEALRHALRLDANVLAIGETRDEVTAEISLRAALTGHRVLTTLHAEDVCTAVLRLLEMGVPPYLLAATLKGAVAQRLVRGICPHCRESYTAGAAEVALFGEEMRGKTLARGRGCAACHGTGYRGRIALFEVLAVDEGFSAAVLAGARLSELRRFARAAGLRPLLLDGRRRVLAHETTAAEVARVLYG